MALVSVWSWQRVRADRVQEGTALLGRAKGDRPAVGCGGRVQEGRRILLSQT